MQIFKKSYNTADIHYNYTKVAVYLLIINGRKRRPLPMKRTMKKKIFSHEASSHGQCFMDNSRAIKLPSGVKVDYNGDGAINNLTTIATIDENVNTQ